MSLHLRTSLLAGLLAISLADPASAEIYRWTDANGVEHFATSLDGVPPEHRAAAKARGAKTGGTVNSFSGPARPEEPGRVAPAAGDPASPDPSAPETAAELHGGRDEAWWRGEYERLSRQVGRHEQRVELVDLH